MKAKKCDRCKCYYDIDSNGAIVNFQVRFEKLIESDLCPDCTAQLKSWIKNESEFLKGKKQNDNN